MQNVKREIDCELSQKEKSQIRQTAIGLQQVEGLTLSAYLIETAKENIEGKITIDEVKYRIDITTSNRFIGGLLKTIA